MDPMIVKNLDIQVGDLEGGIVGRLEGLANCISVNKDVTALVQLSIDVRFLVGVVSGLLGLYLLQGGTVPGDK